LIDGLIAQLAKRNHKLFATINVESKRIHLYHKTVVGCTYSSDSARALATLTANASLQQGKYILDRKLGTGGQGSAYLAHDTAGKQVVLKEYILPVYVDTRVRRRALETFEHEAAMLSKLNNPAVVKLLDVFVEDHRGYLVLEFIDGINLRDYVVKNGPVPEQPSVGMGFVHGSDIGIFAPSVTASSASRFYSRQFDLAA